ncbi:c-type cytochrome [Ramlibacter sp.]|uniref:c-type cytochrome n=1 Tax=Ramlibacter sp. TaxID=1917967 RepID=UPI002639CDD5|nr:c-type cytochrome [Ramlibacter sp.]MDB5953434.1 cytochrome [Ramlibacter sp.]
MKTIFQLPQLSQLLPAVLLLVAAAPARAQDLQRGEQLFTDCRSCHAVQAGVNGVGPSLAGIVGRKSASIEDFRYSPAMKRSGITWDAATLAAFLADPQALVPGNRMPYAGMPNPRDVADLVAYLAKAAAAPH